MSTECHARRVPRGEKRRDEIAAVAEGVFLERGFADTTMQIIAARAGASKETLYRRFGSKEALFSEVVRRRSSRVTGEEGELSGPPERALFDFGLSLLRVLSSSESLCLYRVVMAEIAREPELGRIFYNQGPGRLLEQLAAYLKAAVQRGELRCKNANLAAKLFMGAVVAHHQISKLIIGATFSDAELLAHVREAVSLFLARYQVKDEPASADRL